ncbi:MAG: GNAT family N-acetyltransferase [Saprospiraceae bacterium]|nr:GNAT family N-acetyltransferase [Saprospiraceae bacterium]
MTAYRTFETVRLNLKPTTEEDAAFIRELLNTPKWLQFIGDRNIHTEEDARIYIRNRILPQLERLGCAHYTLLRKVDRKKLGICGLYDREELEGVDIGFALLPEHEGEGYAFEAAQRIKQAALEEFKVSALSGITRQSNLGSQGLLQKLGFRFSGLIQLPDQKEEMMLFKL